MPQRIQRKRTKGWRMPEGTVYVGRRTLFGNPFEGPRAVEVYREYLTSHSRFEVACGPSEGVRLAYIPAWHHSRDVLDALPRLQGKDLACWCPLDQPCHADVLLELANEKVLKHG